MINHLPLDRRQQTVEGTRTALRSLSLRVPESARPHPPSAIVHLLFGTGPRRAELVGLDLDQLEPADPERLRQAENSQQNDL